MEYHTKEMETPARYHNKQDCPDGKRILPQNRELGKGVGRTLCHECPKVSY